MTGQDYKTRREIWVKIRQAMSQPEPHMQGPQGKAWAYDIEAVRRRCQGPPDATLSAHILRVGPCTYLMILVFLRPVPGCPQDRPQILQPGATHEVMLFEVASRWPLDMTMPPFGMLGPALFAGQFQEPGDGDAQQRIVRTIQQVLDGQLDPQDWQAWGDRFSRSNMYRPKDN